MSKRPRKERRVVEPVPQILRQDLAGRVGFWSVDEANRGERRHSQQHRARYGDLRGLRLRNGNPRFVR